MERLTQYELNYLLDTQKDYCSTAFLKKAVKNKKYISASYPHVKIICEIKNEIARLIKNNIITTSGEITKYYIEKYEKLASEYLQ